MPKISTLDCKRFLDGHTSPFMDKTARLTGLPIGQWSRLRKYKDAQDRVARDFMNKTFPVVITLVETPTGIEVSRERALCIWEWKRNDTFDLWFHGNGGPFKHLYRSHNPEKWEVEVMWPSLLPSDFKFGVDEGDMWGNGENSVAFFLQPVTAREEEPWDQHMNLDPLLQAAGATFELFEACECTFECENFKTKEEGIQALTALGFVHDAELDGLSGG